MECLDWTEIFGRAAMSSESWPDALRTLAARTGSNHAQLIGLKGEAGTLFNWVTDMSPDAIRHFDAIHAYTPDTSFRVAALMHAADRRAVLAEGEYAAAHRFLTTDAYADLCETHDIPFGCQALVTPDENTLIGLAVLRSRANGRTDEAVRATFAEAAAAAQNALRLSMAFAGQGTAMVLGAFESMARPAFLIDGAGFVRARSPGTERLLEEDLLVVADGRLGPGRRSSASAAELPAAVNRMLDGDPAAAQTVALDPMVAMELLPLPRAAFDLPFSPRILAAVRGTPARLARRSLMEQFGFTVAEAEVVLHLANGVPRQAIALHRGVSLATVHSQIKSIYQKLECNREAELLVKVRPFMLRDT